MTSDATMPAPILPTAPDRQGLPGRGALLALWLIYGLLTLAGLGQPVVSRVQEARVLETSRQMLDATTWDRWILPQLNGEPRLRKPPLCYWYTAASYKFFGRVDEATGRLPAVLIGWATLAIVWQFGKDLGGRRMAFFSACSLATGTLFLRFIRSAETDAPAMLGVAVALWAIARGARPGASFAWMSLGAVGIAFAGMSKGGPAAFPVAFVGLLAIAERSWRPIKRFVLSGAPLLGMALALPWFAYVLLSKAGGQQVREEVGVLMKGSNHFGLFYEYVPPLLQGLLPWSGWFAIALIAGVATWRAGAFDRAGRVALLSCACVFLPLSVTLNVQPHYLLPMLPGCALLVGWWVARLTDDDARPVDPRLAEATRWVLGIAVVVLALAAAGLPIAGALSPRHVAAIDVLAAAIAASAAAWLLVRYFDASPLRQHVAFAVAMMLTMPTIIGAWWPSLAGEGLRGIAPAARANLAQQLGAPPTAFMTFGEAGNVTLAFYLRELMPLTRDASAVKAFLATNPNGVIVVDRSLGKNRTLGLPPDPLMPDVLRKGWETRYADGTLQFYIRR